jgi:hypothetical protein
LPGFFVVGVFGILAVGGEEDVGLVVGGGEGEAGYVGVGCVKLEVMKKQGSDQAFHDRRYQERKRAEAARKPVRKKVVDGGPAPARPGAKQDTSEPGTAS